MSLRRRGSAGKADGVPLRAEGFPCRPLVRVLRPPFLCFPSQPRFGWLEKTVGVLPGPAPSLLPGRMRPRKPAMTTRPSPQLLSSLRRASLRDELYFSWIPRAAQLPRLSSCKVSRCSFRSKTWEVLSTSGGMPDSAAKVTKPAPAAGFPALSAHDAIATHIPPRPPNKRRLPCSRHHTRATNRDSNPRSNPAPRSIPTSNRRKFPNPNLAHQSFSTTPQPTFPI